MKRSPIRVDPAHRRRQLQDMRERGARTYRDRLRSEGKGRTPLPRSNHARRARLREEQFGEAAVVIRRMPCCSCWPHLYREDRPLPRPGDFRVSDPSHTKTRGAGGKKEHQVPHCRDHHDWFEGQGRHRNGRHEERFGVHTGRLAARIARELG